MKSKFQLIVPIVAITSLQAGAQAFARTSPRVDLAKACVAGLEWYVQQRRPTMRNSKKYVMRHKWCRCFQRVINSNSKYDRTRKRILAEGILYPIKNQDANFDPDKGNKKSMHQKSVAEGSYDLLLRPSACDKEL